MSFFKSSRFALLTAALLTSACSGNLAAKADEKTDAAKAGDGIFKYTITTDFAALIFRVEILVAVLPVEGQPVKYDLDCEGDGKFEYKGLTAPQACFYQKNSGRHQISVRGESLR